MICPATQAYTFDDTCRARRRERRECVTLGMVNLPWQSCATCGRVLPPADGPKEEKKGKASWRKSRPSSGASRKQDANTFRDTLSPPPSTGSRGKRPLPCASSASRLVSLPPAKPTKSPSPKPRRGKRPVDDICQNCRGAKITARTHYCGKCLKAYKSAPKGSEEQVVAMKKVIEDRAAGKIKPRGRCSRRAGYVGARVRGKLQTRPGWVG